MKTRVLLALALLIAAMTAPSVVQDPLPSPKGEIAPNVYHTGTVWLSELVEVGEAFDDAVGLATFEPGTKLDGHVHPGGQLLLVTEGVGSYQEEDGSSERGNS